MNDSTAVSRDFRTEFYNDPVGFRVLLPDRTLGVVKRVQDTDQGRIYKVQGIHQNGRFRALNNLSSWFTGDELRIVYYTAGINPDWKPS